MDSTRGDCGSPGLVRKDEKEVTEKGEIRTTSNSGGLLMPECLVSSEGRMPVTRTKTKACLSCNAWKVLLFYAFCTVCFHPPLPTKILDSRDGVGVWVVGV